MSNGIITNPNAPLGKLQKRALETLRAGGRLVCGSFMSNGAVTMYDAAGVEVGALPWRSALALEDRGLVKFTSGRPTVGVTHPYDEFVLVAGEGR